jgi:hypothetical protein
MKIQSIINAIKRIDVACDLTRTDQATELRRKMLVFDLQAAGADKAVPDRVLDELDLHELEKLVIDYEIVPRVS